MTLVIAVIIWATTAWCLASSISRGWSTGRLAARSRRMLVGAVVAAVVMLAITRALAPPPGFWSWLWLPAAGALGIGVAGMVGRWGEVPWSRPRGVRGGHGVRSEPRLRQRSPVLGVVGASVTVLLGAGLVVLLA